MGYTGVFNIVDCSCVSFPTKATVDKAIDTYPSDYEPLSSICKDIHDECKTLLFFFVFVSGMGKKTRFVNVHANTGLFSHR